MPLPDTVCGYGSREEFERQRLEAGQWVFWDDRVELILAGRYDEVKPLHVELAPTYLCNFSCPWCSCRTARETWVDDNVFNHPKASDDTVMTTARMDRILSHLAEHRVGIQWVGGEPTIYPSLYAAARRAHELGLKQCVFTNGAALSPKRIEALYESDLAFIRVSLNAVTKHIHQLHHDYRPDRNYDERVLRNINDLVRIKREKNARTDIGISVVVDERNLEDVIPTAQYIQSLCEEFGTGAISFAIFRPTYQFYDAQLQLRGTTSDRLRELVNAGSTIETMLRAVGVSTVVPQDSFRTESDLPPAHHGDACLAAGMFGEITPRGDYVACSDRYGNPDYFIGNVAEASVDQLWEGAERSKVLAFARETRCYKTQCPRNGRGYFFNRIFHEVERYRRSGNIHLVRRWIDDLRAVLPRPQHSFFI
jgi:sulfatase maturation enzyme AslB (radical SAM superfamily)